MSLSPLPCGDFMISDLHLFATALAGMKIPAGVELGKALIYDFANSGLADGTSR